MTAAAASLTRVHLTLCSSLQEFPDDGSGGIADAGPPDPLLTDEELFTGCFGGGPGRIPIREGVYNLETGDMFPVKDYDIRVVGTKAPNRETVADFRLRLLPAAAPVIQLR